MKTEFRIKNKRTEILYKQTEMNPNGKIKSALIQFFQQAKYIK